MKFVLSLKIILLCLLFVGISLDLRAQDFLINDEETHEINFNGSYQDFRIPVVEDLGLQNQVTFYMKGADGGKRVVGNKTRKGGGGAEVTATFKIGFGPNEIRPGGLIRFIIGKEGRSNRESGVVGAGGGGGTAVLYTDYFNCANVEPPCIIITNEILLPKLTTNFTPGNEWALLAAAGGGGGAYASGFSDGEGGKNGRASECGSDGNGPAGGNAGCNGEGGKKGGNGPEVYSGGGGGAFSNGTGNVGNADMDGKAGGETGGRGGEGGKTELNDASDLDSAIQRMAGGFGFGGGGSGQKVTLSFNAVGGGGGGGYSGGGGGETAGGGGGGSFVSSAAINAEKKDGKRDGSPNNGRVFYTFGRTSPVVAVCQDQVVTLNEFGSAQLYASDVISASFVIDQPSASFEGACMAFPNSFCGSVFNLNCSDVGTYTLAARVFDNENGMDECIFNLQVKDNVAPTITCVINEVDITVNLGDSINLDITNLMPATAIDLCGALTEFSLSQTSFTCTDVGSNQVMVYALDESENVDSCSITVNVQVLNDNIAPTAICQDLTIQLADDTPVTVSLESLASASTDNCGVVGYQTGIVICDPICLEFSSSEDLVFDCNSLGVSSYNIQVLDGGGNIGTCTAQITLEDVSAPMAVCQDLNVSLDSDGLATVDLSTLAAASIDNCGIAGYRTIVTICDPICLEYIFTDQLSFDCDDIGTVSYEIDVIDHAGNMSTCTTMITIEDSMAPMAVCEDVTLQLDANGYAEISLVALSQASLDNCNIFGRSVTISECNPICVETIINDKLIFGCEDLGSTDFTIKLFDANFNSSTCVSRITVEDGTAPTASCQNLTINLSNPSLNASDLDAGSTDNCSTNLEYLLTIPQMAGPPDVLGVNTNFDCEDVGVIGFELIIKDEVGNSSSCFPVVTIVDDIAPQAECQDLTIQLDNDGQATINALAIDNGSTDACGIASRSLNQTEFSCSTIGSNMVTLTVVDLNDNSATCTAMVTVEDHIPPMIDCFNHTVVFNGEEELSLDPLDLVNGTDNCDLANTQLSLGTINCNQLGEQVPVQVEVSDVNGNTSTCSLIVTVEGLPCDYSQDPDGINCGNGSNADYDPMAGTFTLSSTNCYFGSPFTNDGAAFIGYDFCGDGEFISEIVSTSGLVWAGLQFRESMDADSKKFSLASNGSNFARREIRSQTGGAAFPQQIPAFGKTWIKLVRQGNQFQGFLSSNGLFWQLVMTANMQMNDCIKAGMFLTNLTPNGTVTAVFDQVMVIGASNDALSDVIQTKNLSTEKSGALTIYPNPTSGQITIDLSLYTGQDIQLDLINSVGQRLQTQTFKQLQQFRQEINLSSLPAGLYFIRLQDAEGNEQLEKLILQP